MNERLEVGVVVWAVLLFTGCSDGGSSGNKSKPPEAGSGPGNLSFPALWIEDVSAEEGAASRGGMVFQVTLSAAAPRGATVEFSTLDGTALAGVDYVASEGTLSFPLGATGVRLQIEVTDDPMNEEDETFRIVLTKPLNVTLKDSTGTATILNDDAPPGLAISDAAVSEEEDAARFEVSLSAPSARPIKVKYSTRGESATPGEDYTETAGTLAFAPGEERKGIDVRVIDDTSLEPDETFRVYLSGPVNAQLVDEEAVGTILDDEQHVSGLDTRPEAPGCLLLERPPSGKDYELVHTFRSFSINAVAMLQRPGDGSRWYILERPGRIFVIPNDEATQTRSVFLDIRSRVSREGEGGLLGLAFHPRYAENGQVFVFYTGPGSPMTSHVSRFTTLDGGKTLSSSSETMLLRLEKTQTNHNGGQLAFGPDGYLYIGLGDDGISSHAQDVNSLLGSILRIDVNSGSSYRIPPDNPFAGGGGRPELHAWGFRNPWRWSFDRVTGELWLGDVGERGWEEVNRVEMGRNYGWPVREGAHCYLSPSCDAVPFTDPVAEHSHEDGARAIIGGHVYRGRLFPDLEGVYLYGDWGLRKVWGLFRDEAGRPAPRVLAELPRGANIFSFAEDADGEIFIVAGGGTIFRLAPSDRLETGLFPRKLSDVPCVDPRNPSQPAPGLIPYSVNAPFWSDGADKQRWLSLPAGTTIQRTDSGNWDLPVGTVLIKTFELQGKLIETRLFARHADGEWGGYTYEWNAAQTDAELLVDGKRANHGGRTWVYPSRSECLQCHTQAAGWVLGLEDAQMNRSFTYPQTTRAANQLVTFEHVGLFASPLSEPLHELPILVDPHDEDEPLEARARSYLHTNCSQCHRPEGSARGGSDFRFDVDLEDMGICNASPVEAEPGLPDVRLLVPGKPKDSLISIRMRATGSRRMPPIGTDHVDSAGVKLIDAWIRSLRECP